MLAPRPAAQRLDPVPRFVERLCVDESCRVEAVIFAPPRDGVADEAELQAVAAAPCRFDGREDDLGAGRAVIEAVALAARREGVDAVAGEPGAGRRHADLA